MRYRHDRRALFFGKLPNPWQQDLVVHLEQVRLGFVQRPNERAVIQDDPVATAVGDQRRAKLCNICMPAINGPGHDRGHFVPGREITGAQSIYRHPQAAGDR
jgi:hypothetical protein